MEFEYIPKTRAQQTFSYVESPDEFYRFIDEFNIEKVKWSQPTNISASYFLRLLQEGSSAKARGYGKGYNNERDEGSNQLSEFYSPLLDHCALWKLKSGKVICTAMPYGDKDSIAESFCRMVDMFNYPQTIKLEFLDDKFRFRPNGDYMIVIYCDSSQESFNSNCSDEELRRKAIQYSNSGVLRYQSTVGSYVRNQYVNEYAKRRAHGVCQLCGNRAPFVDKSGKPFLETHHIIWLSDGGADSLDNTVALCPNCHRKMHILNLEEDIEKLLKISMSEEDTYME